MMGAQTSLTGMVEAFSQYWQMDSLNICGLGQIFKFLFLFTPTPLGLPCLKLLIKMMAEPLESISAMWISKKTYNLNCLRNVVMVWIGQYGKQEWALNRNMSSEEPVGRKCSYYWTLRWIWSSMRILSICGFVHAMTTGPSTASGVWQEHNKDFTYKWMDLWNV